MQVKVKKLSHDAVIPSYSKPGDAGLDLIATWMNNDSADYTEYGTGLAFEIPEGFVGLIFPRSSISNKSFVLSNSVGVIDSSYRGEIKFRFKNAMHYRAFGERYKVGDKIGQLMIMPYPQIELIEAKQLSSTERGESGFGSSGQ